MSRRHASSSFFCVNDKKREKNVSELFFAFSGYHLVEVNKYLGEMVINRKAFNLLQKFWTVFST